MFAKNKRVENENLNCGTHLFLAMSYICIMSYANFSLFFKNQNNNILLLLLYKIQDNNMLVGNVLKAKLNRTDASKK